MSDTQKVFTLTCQSRETSREANESLKKENKIPAVVYGKDFSNLNISVKLADFERVYAEAKKSSFIDFFCVLNKTFAYKSFSHPDFVSQHQFTLIFFKEFIIQTLYGFPLKAGTS